MSISLYYITAKDREEATKIARALVAENIAACANILDSALSVYRWEGTVCEERESVIFVKSKSSLAKKLIERVTELHSYDCPCIVELPLTNGNPEYIDWVNSQTLP